MYKDNNNNNNNNTINNNDHNHDHENDNNNNSNNDNNNNNVYYTYLQFLEMNYSTWFKLIHKSGITFFIYKRGYKCGKVKYI